MGTEHPQIYNLYKIKAKRERRWSSIGSRGRNEFTREERY